MKILMIVGSLRKESFNRQLALEAKKLIGERAEVSILDYNAVPLFNQDLEPNDPQAVVDVRREVSETDGIWIFTPEYNLDIPGVLKNLLDWLSRSNIPNDWKSGTPLMGKKVTISGVGGKNESHGAISELMKLMLVLRTKVMEEDNFGFAVPGPQMASGKWTISESDIEKLTQQVNAFLAFLKDGAA